MKNILYFHGGSGNHGCEAIVRTLIDICKLKDIVLYSRCVEEDIKFKINEIVDEIKPSKLDAEEIDAKGISYSIGGDNYSYLSTARMLTKYNQLFTKDGTKTTLIGCSINPNLLNYKEVIEDLKMYDLITARESITNDALLYKGIKSYLIPDSAFALKPIYLDLPIGFEEGNTIGINLSSLIQGLESSKGIAFENYKTLVDYIIKNTSYQIALIPHVIQSFNDDLKTLTKLYEIYKDTNRIVLIGEGNCMELKGYIARCEMFIGARTHSTIASYSSCIPTLVVGYSIKSRGIAKDLFGSEENYVLPVQNLKEKDDLTKSFIWLSDNKDNIKKHLEEIIPNYIKKCYELGGLVESICRKK